MALAHLAATWLGHGTFLFRSPGGRRILIDPFLENNPACPSSFKTIDALDLLLITHGHSDHIEEAARVATSTGATVVGIWEVCQWLLRRGVQKVSPMNKGGSQELAGVRVSMVHALHSSSYTEEHGITYLGEAAGYVLKFENSVTIYFAGDTGVFSDMALIRELYAPTTAFLPIGDLFTMGPDGAAKACELLGVRRVVPMHFATFPPLTGTPQALRRLVEPRGVKVLELKPGEMVEIED
jgi:L-ascorbate metabolism protein UlaG (beta-lactamase superfamily)